MVVRRNVSTAVRVAAVVAVCLATVSHGTPVGVVSPPPHLAGLPSQFASAVVRGDSYVPHMCAPTLCASNAVAGVAQAGADMPRHASIRAQYTDNVLL